MHRMGVKTMIPRNLCTCKDFKHKERICSGLPTLEHQSEYDQCVGGTKPLWEGASGMCNGEMELAITALMKLKWDVHVKTEEKGRL